MVWLKPIYLYFSKNNAENNKEWLWMTIHEKDKDTINNVLNIIYIM